MFNLNACLEEVKMEVEEMGFDPYKELGKAIIKAETDPLFNKMMIEAWKIYIKENMI